MPQVWDTVEVGSRATDIKEKSKIHEMYTDVASLYHLYRPKYPESLIDQAVELSPLLLQNGTSAAILEIGCGPGTLTFPLAKRGFQCMSIDPGSGMIDKARNVCDEFSNIDFRQVSFKDLETDGKQFDAIFAGSSLHWALAEKDREDMMRKLHRLLKPDGTLLLFWNFPSEPSDIVLDAVAVAIDQPKPFYFGNGSLDDHTSRLKTMVLDPLVNSKLFAPFSIHDCSIDENLPILHFLSYLRTLSNYITMGKHEQKHFFKIVEETLRRECGESIKTGRKSILNVSKKLDEST